jgi:hypothetical protein
MRRASAATTAAKPTTAQQQNMQKCNLGGGAENRLQSIAGADACATSTGGWLKPLIH